jgi:hypothetical protein
MYPDDSVQGIVGGWWEPASGAAQRGRLIRTHVHFPDMKPHRLTPIGRGDDARQHSKAQFVIDECRLTDPPAPVSSLPVAGIPLFPNESYFVRRGKVRPAVVISLGGVAVASATGAPKWQTNRAFLVAPFYGADQDSSRAGWRPAFVERIRRGEYPQYVWDRLPITGAEEAILRLDHTFAVGSDPASYETLPFRLSDAALKILDQWFTWLMTNELSPECDLGWIRAELRTAFDSPQST